MAGFLFSQLLTICCGAITIKVNRLPVFEPNEYFWEHHWQKGKEDLWEAYARVVRQIMSEVGGLKLSNLTMQDKFDYIEQLNKLQREKHT